MTDFVVSPSFAFQFENLEWDYTPPEGAFVQSGTLDVSGFNAAQHYPNGYIQSGMILAKRNADSLVVPWLAANSATAPVFGVLRASVPITRAVGATNRARVGIAALVHGVVSQGRLPYTSGNAALGGFVDAGAKTGLPLIYWAA